MFGGWELDLNMRFGIQSGVTLNSLCWFSLMFISNAIELRFSFSSTRCCTCFTFIESYKLCVYDIVLIFDESG
jgi:hypothetical protein